MWLKTPDAVWKNSATNATYQVICSVFNSTFMYNFLCFMQFLGYYCVPPCFTVCGLMLITLLLSPNIRPHNQWTRTRDYNLSNMKSDNRQTVRIHENSYDSQNRRGSSVKVLWWLMSLRGKARVVHRPQNIYGEEVGVNASESVA